MSTRNITEEIVQMTFDNAQFERNIKESQRSIEDLRHSINNAGSGVALTGIQDAVDRLNGKFNALSIAGITAIQNFTNKAIDAATQLSRSFSNTFLAGPFNQGFGEYELKMGSIQTIMASTGESLETVNGYLDELNTYADKTIYSFSDMTSNIGKFTNAGVDLKTAVKAIQGISNAAALAGANSNEASRAMYNFAQALSAGYVKLIDWKSIENANMATKQFKQELIDTAVKLGTVVKVGEDYQTVTTDNNGKVSQLFNSTKNFNDALSAQWMTTEVLTTTLGKYSNETEEIGKKAFAAAQDVKTFHQLLDTLKEAIGSGWAKTFEIIIGDFEEAKELFTSISKVVGGFIDKVSDARNNLLEAALGPMLEGEFISAGKTVEDAKNKLEEYEKLALEIERGDWGNGQERIDRLTAAGYSYAAAMMLVNRDLINATFNMDAFTEAVGSATEATEELTAESSKTGRQLLLEGLANTAKAAIRIFQTLGEAYRQIFPPVTAQTIRDLIVKFHDLSENLIIHGKTVYQLRNIFKGVLSVFRLVIDAVKSFGRVVMPIAVKVVGALAKGFMTVIEPIARFITIISEAVHESDLFYKIFNGIKEIGSNLFDNITKGITGVFDAFGVTLPKVSDFRDKIVNVAKSIAGFISSFDMTPVVEHFSKLFSNIPGIIQKFANAIRDAVTRVKEFFGAHSSGEADEAEKKITLFGKLGELISKIIQKIRAIGSKLVSGVKEFFSLFTSSEADVAEKKTSWLANIAGTLKSAWDKVYEVLKRIGTAIKTAFSNITGFDVIGKVATALQTFFSSLGSAAAGFAQKRIEQISSLGPKIKDAFGKVTEVLKALVSRIGELFGVIKDSGVVQNVFSKFIDILGRAKDAIVDWATSINFEAVFGGIKNFVNNTLIPIVSAIKDKLGDAFIFLRDKAITPAITKIREWYKSLDGSTALEKARSAFEGSIFAEIPDIIQNLINKFNEFYSSLEGETVFAKFKSAFETYIKDPILNSKIIETIRPKVEAFWEWLQEIIAKVKEFLFGSEEANVYDQAAETISSFSESLSQLSGVKIDTSALDSASTFLTQASSTITALTGGAVDTSKIDNVTGAINSISGAVTAFSANGIDTAIFDKAEGTLNQVSSVISSLGGQGTEQIDNATAMVDSAKQFVESLPGLVNGGVDISEGTSGLSAVLDGIATSLSNLGKKASEKFSGSTIAEVFDKIIGAFGKIADAGGKAVDFVGSLFEMMTKYKWTIPLVLRAISIIENIKIKKSFSTLLTSLSNSLPGANKTKSFGENMMDLAKAVAVLTAALWVLTKKIDRNELYGAFQDITLIFTALIGFSWIANQVNEKQNAIADLGKSILQIAAAMVILRFAVGSFAKMDPTAMAKGLAPIIVLLGVFTFAMRKLNQVDNKGVSGKVILSFAAAMLVLSFAVKKLGSLDIVTLIKGMGSIILLTGAISLFTLAAKKANKKGDKSGAKGVGAAILGFAAGMLILAYAIEKIGNIPMDKLIKGMGTILASMLAIRLILPKPENVKNVGTQILLLSVAMLVLGKAIENIGSLNIGTIIKALLAVTLFFGQVRNLANKTEHIGKTSLSLAIISASILLFAGAMKLIADVGAWGLFKGTKAITAILQSITNVTSTGTDVNSAVATFLSLAGCLIVITAVLYILNDLPTEGVVGNALAISAIMAALGYAMEKVSGLKTGPMKEMLANSAKSAVALLVGIAIVVAAVAAIGLLMETKFGQELGKKIVTGIQNFEKIGNALGHAIGTFLGNLVEGFTESMPGIAENLSSFMNKLQPFLDSVSNIDESQSSGIDTVMSMLERLVKNEIWSAVADLLGEWAGEGHQDMLVKYSEGLVQFGDALKTFDGKLSELDLARVDTGVTFCERIADMSNSIETIDLSFKRIFVGGRASLGEFGTELVALGTCLKDFSGSLAGVNMQRLTIAGPAMQAFADVANSLPTVGGIKAKFVGHTETWSEFAKGMPELGKALAGFSTNIGTDGIKVESIKTAAEAAGHLSTLQKNLPLVDGWEQKLSGKNMSWSQFAEGMPELGEALKAYADSTSTISATNAGAMKRATMAARGISDLAKELPKEGGIMQSIFGSQNLGLFGQNVESFSEALNTFCTNSASTNFDDGQKSLDFVQSMIDLAEKIKGDGDTSTMTDSLWSFVTSMGNVATDAREKFTKGIKPIESEIQDVLDEYEKQIITNGLGSTDMQDKFHDAGYELVTKFNGGINDKIPDVKNRVNTDVITTAIAVINSRRWEFSAAGRIVIGEFIDGMGSRGQNARNAAYRIGNNAAYGLSDARGGAYNAGRNVAYGFADGMYSLFNYVYNTAYNMGISAVNGARRALRVMSPSRVFMQIGEYTGEGLVIGMQDQYGSVEDASAGMGKTALDSMAEMMNRVKMLLDGTDEFNPTITPVLDLSKIQQGVGQIDGMFNTPHLAIPGTKVLGDLNTTSANIDIKDQIRQGVLEAFNSMPNAATNETNNIYINGADSDPNEIADAVIDKLNLRYNQRRAVFG